MYLPLVGGIHKNLYKTFTSSLEAWSLRGGGGVLPTWVYMKHKISSSPLNSYSNSGDTR